MNNKTINIVLATIRRKLGEQVKLKAKKGKAEKIGAMTNGVACPEPCPFPRCLKTCSHEQQQEHDEHYCSDHKSRPKVFQQQREPEPMDQSDGAVPRWTKAQKKVLVPEVEESDNDQPVPLIDESSSGEDAPMALEDSSEDDSDDDSDDDKHERQQASEAITGHLDFDYNEVNLVKPSGQLQNRLRNLITQTWSILDEEYKSFGELHRYVIPKIPDDAPNLDPKQVWWTESRQERVKPSVSISRYYKRWRSFQSSDRSSLPSFGPNTRPESFYTKTRLPVITPSNVDSFIQHMQQCCDIPITIWSWYQPMGHLPYKAIGPKETRVVLFPVELRYGWDIREEKIQNKLLEIDQLFKPQVTIIDVEDQPFWQNLIPFISDHCQGVDNDDRRVCLMAPRHSTVWEKPSVQQLVLEEVPKKDAYIKANFELRHVAEDLCRDLCDALMDDVDAAIAEDIYETYPTKRVRTADDLAKEAARKLQPGGIHTKHLACPFCPERFSSSSAIRYHKISQHFVEYNEDRKKRGLTLLPPKPKRAKIEERLSPESAVPAEAAAKQPEPFDLLPQQTSPQNVDPPKLSDPGDQIRTTQWEQLPFSSAQRCQPTLPREAAGQWSELPVPTIQRKSKPMIRNLLRGIRTYKKDARFAGGLPRARSMLAKKLLESLQPTTNPVQGDADQEQAKVPDEPMPVPTSAPAAMGPSGDVMGNPPNSGLGTTQTARPRPSAAPQVSRKVRKKMHKDDLAPYTDDFYSYLTAEDIPDLTTDDLLVGNDADLPPEARKCPIDVRRLIRNAHNNLGHPSNHAMVRLMKTAKCHPDMLAYARHMKCPTCARRQPPARIPKATMPYRPTRFNAVVGLDLKWVKDASGETYYLLNILDLATAFNVSCVVANKRPSTIAEAFKQNWMSWAMTPEKVVADKGTEYFTDFQAMLTDLGIAYRLVPVESPWQHGMVERHGQVLAEIIQAIATEKLVSGMQQMKDVALHTCMAKNRRPGRTGYSPRTLVFGVDERLVASGLNHYLEQPDDASIAAAGTNPDFKKSMELRKAAMMALVDMDHSDKWKDAIQFPSRKANCAMFLPGHQVFFWKKAQTSSNLKGRGSRLPERWYGPGVIVGHEWDQGAQRDSYWVSYGGKCFLTAGTHLRHAEFEECLAHEKFIEEMQKTFKEVSGPTFQYADVRNSQMDPEQVIGSALKSPMRDVDSKMPGEGEDTSLTTKIAKAPSTPARPTERRERPSPATGIFFPQVSHAPTPRRPEATDGVTDVPMRTPAQVRTPRSPAAVPVSRSPIPQPEFVGKTSWSDGTEAAKQTTYALRGSNHVFVVDEDKNECYFLQWKTFNKIQRKGRELDPKFFNQQERALFNASDAKEWQSFLDTGAVVIIPPKEAAKVPHRRIFNRPMRYVRTNKNKTEEDLLAKSRIVTPGDVDPDGDIPVEDGGFRTDAPTCPQIGFHLLCSQAVLKKRRLGTFDCKTAFLTGKEQNREIYCRPPKEGLPGVPPGSLLKLVKGTYGLREAPRLWYLRAREVLLEAGFEEMQTARACFCVYDRSNPKEVVNVGMLVLHVDDAAYAGEGPIFEKAMQHLRKKFIIGKEEFDDFVFLGRHVVQKKNFEIEIDQKEYVQSLTKVAVSKDRRAQTKSRLTAKEEHDYRSIVGQLAWPARESMPQLAYSVSDLQQKVAQATVGDLVHANNVLNAAKRQVAQGQKLNFKDLGPDVLRVDVQHSMKHIKTAKKKFSPFTRLNFPNLGMAAVHDASFMGQPKEGSQSAYCLMLCSTKLYEGKARTHLLDWGSGKIHRKMRSTLACEAASAAKAFDRGAYARVMLYEIENSWKHKYERFDEDDCHLRQDWSHMCQKVPFALGTDCKSLYDVCTKQGSMPEERRVALDLLDVRESIEEYGDQMRWIPTDHMLVDCMTKTMPADAMLEYLKSTEYAFKYDDVIKYTKRAIAKQRKDAREKKLQDLPQDPKVYDDYEVQQVNILDHYDIYYPMFQYAYPAEPNNITSYHGDYRALVKEHGYRSAYVMIVDQLCVGG